MNEKENGVESRINQGKAKVLNAALYLIHLVVHHPQGNGRRLLMPNGYHLALASGIVWQCAAPHL
jgi:hypothetical protein